MSFPYLFNSDPLINEKCREAYNSHEWNPNQTECPECLKCNLSPISAHIWGDDEWTKEPIYCK